MTKKAIVAIEFVAILLAIVIISVFGLNPETWRNDVPVNSLGITNQSNAAQGITITRQTVNGREVVYAKIQRGTKEFQITWEILPENATNKRISFTSAEINANIISVNDTGLVSFLTTSNQGASIMLSTTDGTNRRAEIVITFTTGGSGGDIEL